MKEIIDLVRQYGGSCFSAALEIEETFVLDGPKMKESINLETELIQAIRDKIEGDKP